MRSPSCRIKSEEHAKALLVILTLIPLTSSLTSIVQTLSSRYAIVLGGYGPGYTELSKVEVVRHDKVCHNAVTDIPPALARFLGDTSGLAEFVDDKVMFCRHTACWRLDMRNNTWARSASLHVERDQAASVSLGERMAVIGGQGPQGGVTASQLELYDPVEDVWTVRDDLSLEVGRFSFCAVPLNSSSLMVLGGWGSSGQPLASVEVLNLDTGTWRPGPQLTRPRYGHTCLLTEMGGRQGVMVAGGALTGKIVEFLDLKTGNWEELASTNYKIDGHKLILVEGIPTIFSWENIEQFNGKSWELQPFRLPQSRSAFAVTSVPGHLVRGC